MTEHTAQSSEGVPGANQASIQQAIARLKSADFSFRAGSQQVETTSAQVADALSVLAELDAQLEAVFLNDESVSPQDRAQFELYRTLTADIRAGVEYRQLNHLPAVQEQERRIRQAFPSMSTQHGYRAVAEQMLVLSQQPDAAATLLQLQEEAHAVLEQLEEMDTNGTRALDIRELYAAAHELTTGSALLTIDQVTEQFSAAQQLLVDIQRATPLFELFKQPWLQEDSYLFLLNALKGFAQSVQDHLQLSEATRQTAQFLVDQFGFSFRSPTLGSEAIVRTKLAEFRAEAEAERVSVHAEIEQRERATGFALLQRNLRQLFSAAEQEADAHLKRALRSAEQRLHTAIAAEQLLQSAEVQLLQDIQAMQQRVGAHVSEQQS